jgi:hypothetical protein
VWVVGAGVEGSGGGSGDGGGAEASVRGVDGEVCQRKLELQGLGEDDEVGVWIFGKVLKQFFVELVVYLQTEGHEECCEYNKL